MYQCKITRGVDTKLILVTVMSKARVVLGILCAGTACSNPLVARNVVIVFLSNPVKVNTSIAP